jgi:glycosyltransferase involved in cell wall biosynthesis
MPSKTQAALASGRALLVAAEGDVAAVVAESGAGFTASPGQPATIAAAIESACALGRTGLAEMGARARGYYERTFSVEQGVQRLESLLEDAVRTRRVT